MTVRDVTMVSVSRRLKCMEFVCRLHMYYTCHHDITWHHLTTTLSTFPGVSLLVGSHPNSDLS